jgi:hypothetical protein
MPSGEWHLDHGSVAAGDAKAIALTVPTVNNY